MEKMLIEKRNIDERVEKMYNDTVKNNTQHFIINSAPSMDKLQPLYSNSVSEWFRHPKCKIALDVMGIDGIQEIGEDSNE